MKRGLIVSLVIVLAIPVVLASCLLYSGREKGNREHAAFSTAAMIITDSKGKQVTVPSPPQRIAGLGGAYGLETLLAFGLKSEIVAMADYAKMREDFKLFVPDVPDVGRSSRPNIEQLLSVNPDLVLAYAIYSFPEMEQVLAAHNIALVQMDFFVPDKYEREVRTLGKILRRESRAEELIAFEKEHLLYIADRVNTIKPAEKVRVYLESYQTYQAESPRDPAHDPVLECGGINIFADASVKNPLVSAEAVVTGNPDIIIKNITSQYCPRGYGVTDPAALAALRAEIMNRPGWQQINAVKNGRVYIISTDTRSIHPSIYNSYLVKWFYPAMFPDLKPANNYRAWLRRFMGMDLQGVYVYPDS